MTFTVRGYEDSDLPTLQECIMRWRQQDPNGTYCHPGDIPHRLYNGNRGQYPLGEIARIYSLEGEIVAILLCYPRHKGFDIFVHPDYRDDMRRLLPVLQAGFDICYTYMVRAGNGDKPVMADSFQTDTALARLFENAGFIRGNNYINVTQRPLAEIPDIVLPEGFSIRPARMDDAEHLAQVHSRSFGSNWTAELYRNEVMHKPGYTPERELIIVAPDGTFAAFCVTWLDHINRIGLFEPVGTHEDYRRLGMARALMCYGMRDMLEKGMTTAEVAHKTDNPASSALYKNMGFETVHHVYEWAKYATLGKETDTPWSDKL